MILEKEGVLHIIYRNLSEIDEIVKIATVYEGSIPRIGFNFPFDFIRTVDPKSSLLKTKSKIEYVICYKQGDVLTKKHELQHAKFYMDAIFRSEVEKLWLNLSIESRTYVIQLLRKMKYKDEVLLDEFQAYYFTEPKLFGKLIFDS